MSAPTNDLDSTAETPPYRLPTTVRPHAYRLVLTPDLAAATFAGDVEIDVTVESPTPSITLNAAELVVTFAELNDSDPDAGYALAPTDIAHDPDEERVTLTFAESLRPGPATLHLAFTGILNDKLHGFYRSHLHRRRRRRARHRHHPVRVHRRPPGLSRAGTSPSCKAIFAVTLVVDDGLAAFSNGPDGRARRPPPAASAGSASPTPW